MPRTTSRLSPVNMVRLAQFGLVITSWVAGEGGEEEVVVVAVTEDVAGSRLFDLLAGC